MEHNGWSNGGQSRTLECNGSNRRIAKEPKTRPRHDWRWLHPPVFIRWGGPPMNRDHRERPMPIPRSSLASAALSSSFAASSDADLPDPHRWLNASEVAAATCSCSICGNNPQPRRYTPPARDPWSRCAPGRLPICRIRGATAPRATPGSAAPPDSDDCSAPAS